MCVWNRSPISKNSTSGFCSICVGLVMLRCIFRKLYAVFATDFLYLPFFVVRGPVWKALKNLRFWLMVTSIARLGSYIFKIFPSLRPNYVLFPWWTRWYLSLFFCLKGPDGIRDHDTAVLDPNTYVGIGTMSPEGSSDLNYLWRPSKVRLQPSFSGLGE